ncbi:hypothetical protein SLM20_001576 [Listeria innocua]|nr:hypothetical protein [Listeria innocua]ELY0485685.1 hypothetical protein [Listeria innocua]ELY0494500.1 hypothetical protein [Listeria innocua]
MKKIIMMILVMSIGLFACGNNKESKDPVIANEVPVETEKDFSLQIPDFYNQTDTEFVESAKKTYSDLEAKGDIERVFGKSGLEVEIVSLNGQFFEKDQVIGLGVFVANNSGKDIDSFSMDLELQVEGYPEAKIASENVQFGHDMIGTMKANSIMPLKVLLPCQNFDPNKDTFTSKELKVIFKNVKVNKS